MHKNDKLSNEVIKKWPDIFSDITIYHIPLEYVKSMTISFSDGKKMYIDVEKSDIKNNDREYLKKSLKNFLNNYREEIEDVDFNLNVKSIKENVENFTNRLITRYIE